MRAPTRTTTLGPASALVILLALGLALRVIIAYQLPGSGFNVDLTSFRFWAGDLAAHGPFGFYDRGFFADYTPGYLYLLWIVGIAGQALGGIGDLIKAPPILADLALAWLVKSMVRELGGSTRTALVAAAIVLFTPITWFDSVVWGQVDSVGVVVLLLSVRELWRDRPERATAFGTLAAIIKPQLGIIVPIAAAVILRRYVWEPWVAGRREAGRREADRREADRREAQAIPPAGDGEDAGAPEALDAEGARRPDRWFDRFGRGPARLVTSAIVGMATATLVSAPFGLTPIGLIVQIVKTAGGYPFLTVNAYNPWALFSHAGTGIADSGQWLCDAVSGDPALPVAQWTCPPGTETLIFGIPAVIVGTGLLVLAILGIAFLVFRRPDRQTILVGMIVLALAFFVLPTRVHERYLFPFFALAAILAAASWRWAAAYVVLTIATFANMYVVLTTLYPGNPSISDWLGIGPSIRAWSGVALISLVHLIGFVWAALQLRPAAADRLERELAAAAEPGDGAANEPAWGGLAGFGTDPEGGTAGSGAGPGIPGYAGATGEPGLVALPSSGAGPVGSGGFFASLTRRPGEEETGPFAGIRRRLFVRPLRPDRSRSLFGEPTGRIDRLDIWFVLVIVVAALTLRTFRLSEPYDMHFDEVYHARTATEFLQDWRYGIPHSIYEYTHPHLAKYAIAAGIVMFGDDRVTAQSELGVPVRDAAIEPRWDDAGASGTRAGDRLYVATGSGVRAYDLLTRALVADMPIPGAQAVAVDTAGHRLLVGTADGTVLALATPQLDARRASGSQVTGPDPTFAGPARLATAGAPINRLFVTDDGAYVLATTTTQRVVSLDGATGTVLGSVSLPGVTEVASAGTGEALVAQPSLVSDQATEANLLAKELGGKASDYLAKLRSGGSQVVIAGPPAADVRTRLDAAIADGRLAGLSFVQLPRVAAADTAGLAFIEPATGTVVQNLGLDAPATGLALVSGLDAPRLYVASGRTVKVINVGTTSDSGGQLTIETVLAMPGETRDVTYDPSSVMVHVLGTTADGSSTTIYVIEPHGNAVYADARVPFQPAAWATDAAPLFPSSDRQAILAFAADGSMASIDIGRHAFAWRLPGVILGALTAGLLYLLARILFRRRSVAVLAGIFALADGMAFVQSRIAMNDVYVGFFIVAAYTLFAAVWTGAWRWRGAFWVSMPVIGLLLGLGLASKWVALYAIAALGILILARSALGRVIVIGAMTAATTVLGYIAISVPNGETANGNFTFMVIMLVLTLLAVLVTVLHPIAWSPDEVRFAIGAPFVAGLFILGVALPLGLLHGIVVEAAFGLVLLAVVAAVTMRVAAAWGFGPLAPPPAADDPVRLLEPPAPAAEGWLRLGSGFGLPAAWMGVTLLLIPIVVYVISYLPWVALGNRLTDNWPPGNQGQTLLQLTQSMYDYHNNLRATHAASSPWWAWPLDFKPVWFYQGSFAAGTAGSIYDAGNLIIWWLGLPALAFCAWQAFKRRSLGLGLVLIGFAWQWLSWSRIDRATFQYHYYTSLPFLFIALAYFIAEIWHGPSIRTWLLVRLAAAAALLGPAILWLGRSPLCAYVRVNAVNPGSQACTEAPPGDLVLTMRTAAMGLVMLVAAITLIREVVRLEDDRRDGGLNRLGRLAAVAGVATLALTIVLRFVPDDVIFSAQSFAPEALAIVILIPLGFVAWFVVTARDARRFVGGAVAASVVWFVILYPNISALPLPSILVNAYQGLLPTYLYPFQFPVNTDPPGPLPKLLALEPMVLFGALALTCLVVGYSASVWRVALAERRAAVAAREGDPLAAGAGGGMR